MRFFKCDNLDELVGWLSCTWASGREWIIKSEGMPKIKEPQSHRVIGSNDVELRRYNYARFTRNAA